LIESILLRGEEVIVQLMLTPWVLSSRSLFVLVWGVFIFGTLGTHYLFATSCNFYLMGIGNCLNRFVWFLCDRGT
jgi:predicted Zn-dependent protease